MALEHVSVLSNVEPERGRCAARCIRETGRDTVLRERRTAAVRDREWTFENRQRPHVEDVAAWLGARQTVIDEVQQGLSHLVGMGRLVGEVTAERGLERFWMTQRANRRGEGVKRGGGFRQQTALRCLVTGDS